jgi:hypothetical protein
MLLFVSLQVAGLCYKNGENRRRALDVDFPAQAVAVRRDRDIGNAADPGYRVIPVLCV